MKSQNSLKDILSSKVILVLSLLLIIACVSMVTHMIKDSNDLRRTEMVACPLSKEKILDKIVPNKLNGLNKENGQNMENEQNKKNEPSKEKAPKEEEDLTDKEESSDNDFNKKIHGVFHNFWNDHTSHTDLNNVKKTLDLRLRQSGGLTAKYVLPVTKEFVTVLVAMKPGFKRKCHRHPVNFQVHILQGQFYVKTHGTKKPVIAKPGDHIFIPKWQPHVEGVHGRKIVYALDVISPNVNPDTLVEYLSDDECSTEKFPPVNIPKIETNEKPNERLLPEHWTATVLMHPFSEEQGVGPEKDYPFFQLTYGKVTYDSNAGIMLIHVKGCSYGEWWFRVSGQNNMTAMSNDSKTWHDVDLGWSLPSRNWTDPDDVYVGHSLLNWMNDKHRVDWWKKNYQNTSTWTWFDRKNNGLPFRLMFSAPPKSNFKGERENLALFQMYSFSYLVDFKEGFTDLENLTLDGISSTGFTCGNDQDYPLFNWTHHFSLSAFMIPVDHPHNPYPTKVYYHWKTDLNYTGNPFDRCQSTIFYHDYNFFEMLESMRADLFGHWDGREKRKGQGFLTKTSLTDWQTVCEPMVDGDMPIAQQPPWWPKLGLGKIVAVIRKPDGAGDNWTSPITHSNRTVAIIRVTFPPHEPNFPNSTSLWTWYDYTEFLNGGEARPIVFIQSAPKFNLGTSLALADFFDFNVLSSDMHSRTRLDYEHLKNYCNFS